LFAKPRLDGRCEWQREGVAIVIKPGVGMTFETIEACLEPAVDGKTEWCTAHKCREDGCRLARVVGEVCVGHMPGSLKSARTARLAAIGAAE
jgi:hypothetical protein